MGSIMKVIILTSPALAPLWAGLHESVMPEWPYHSCKVTKLENLGLTQISQLEWPRVSAAHFYSLIFVSLYFYIWCRKYFTMRTHYASYVLIQSASNGGHNMHTCHYTHTHGQLWMWLQMHLFTLSDCNLAQIKDNRLKCVIFWASDWWLHLIDWPGI